MRRRIIEQYRQDCDALNTELGYELERQRNDLDAKLAARRARKLKDSQRQSEEEAAQKFLEQQVWLLRFVCCHGLVGKNSST